ncbi:MAG: DUF3127 domain-containing protein [Bacteroidales bacterium]|jgi:hypothetical protein|nr:DUF3127 domain-containing protein [Bacteroidales bacterium]
MALEVIGKVQQILPQQSGVGKNGAWSKREFIIETLEQYPRKICISVWGDKSDSLEQQHPVGSTVKAGINIESREYNGKWYTDVRAWKIDAATEERSTESPTFATDDNIGTFVDNEMDEMLPF